MDKRYNLYTKFNIEKIKNKIYSEYYSRLKEIKENNYESYRKAKSYYYSAVEYYKSYGGYYPTYVDINDYYKEYNKYLEIIQALKNAINNCKELKSELGVWYHAPWSFGIALENAIKAVDMYRYNTYNVYYYFSLKACLSCEPTKIINGIEYHYSSNDISQYQDGIVVYIN